MAKKDSGKVLKPQQFVDPVPAKKPRFGPAGLDQFDGYEGTEFRRWEVYQKVTIRGSLKMRGILNPEEDLDPENEEHVHLCARQLITCLVAPLPPHGKGARKLHRPGASGLNKVKMELMPEDIVAAFIRALDHSEVKV